MSYNSIISTSGTLFYCIVLNVAHSQTSAVHASEEKAGTVGALLHVDLNTEGLPVKAMVDTGVKSTIVSRSTLHGDVNSLVRRGWNSGTFGGWGWILGTLSGWGWILGTLMK